MRRNLFWLSDPQWEQIEPRLPTDVRGVERADDRRVISGIIHALKSGSRWCDCPPEYGPPTTVYNRFVRWAFDLINQVLRVRGKLTAEDHERIQRVAQLFGIDERWNPEEGLAVASYTGSLKS